MTRIFIATGHGYEAGSQGRCTAFDAYHVIARPLPTPEERSFSDGPNSPGVTYGSFSLMLAHSKAESDAGLATRTRARSLYLLIQHGGGREVMALPGFASGAGMIDAWRAMPDAALYATLFTLYRTAQAARDVARDEERIAWKQAHVDKRIRTRRRPSTGTIKVWIEPARNEGESDENYEIRKMLAAPSKAR